MAPRYSGSLTPSNNLPTHPLSSPECRLTMNAVKTLRTKELKGSAPSLCQVSSFVGICQAICNLHLPRKKPSHWAGPTAPALALFLPYHGQEQSKATPGDKCCLVTQIQRGFPQGAPQQQGQGCGGYPEQDRDSCRAWPQSPVRRPESGIELRASCTLR